MSGAEDDVKQIEAIIERYRLAFATLDIDALKDLWDPSHAPIVYIAQERAEPAYGWPAVEDYYDRFGRSMERVISMTLADIVVGVLGDAAYAGCRWHFQGEVKGQSQPRIVDGRNTFVLRRASGGWKVIHYHESAPGPLPVDR